MPVMEGWVPVGPQICFVLAPVRPDLNGHGVTELVEWDERAGLGGKVLQWNGKVLSWDGKVLSWDGESAGLKRKC